MNSSGTEPSSSASGQVWDRILISSAYLYLIIPTVIFLFGWLRLPIAILVFGLVAFGAWRALTGFGYGSRAGLASLTFLLPVLCIVGLWVLLSGIDGFGFQNVDFDARNAVFRDLIGYPWPVRYDYSASPPLQQAYGNSGALVYYLAYWLPSALIGKWLGWDAANHALFFWSVLGVLLSILLICRYNKAFLPITALAFVFWSGMDFIGTMLYDPPSALKAALAGQPLQFRGIVGQTLALLFGGSHLEEWTASAVGIVVWQYSSFTTQLFWVFNQAIPAWIVTALLLNQQDKKSLVYTYSLVLLFAPLPAIGLVPFLVYRLLEGVTWDRILHVRDILRETLSVQNTVVPASLAAIAVAYLGAQGAEPVQGFVWQFHQIDVWLILGYVAFCVLEFALFAVLLMSYKGGRGLVATAMAVLFVLPIYKFGVTSDLVMRASIPALLVLFVIGMQYLASEAPSRARRFVLMAILLIGAVTPLHEIARSSEAIVSSQGALQSTDSWHTFGPGGKILGKHLQYSEHFVISMPEDTFFFRFLARQ